MKETIRATSNYIFLQTYVNAPIPSMAGSWALSPANSAAIPAQLPMGVAVRAAVSALSPGAQHRFRSRYK
jgi:hypothetical protein